MTAARASRLKPTAPPAPVLRSHPELPARDFKAVREDIPTACGRVVERQKRAEGGGNLYRLWEPVAPGSDYAKTWRDAAGKTWGSPARAAPT